MCGGMLVAGSPFKINVLENVSKINDWKLYGTNKQYASFVDPPENSAQLLPRRNSQPLPQKVVAIGPGLTTAFAQKVANFAVDASNAGDGE